MSQNDGTGVGISANLDTEVGKLIIDMGLATRTELEFCREQLKQASDPNQRSLADLLVENQFITVNQAKRIRNLLTDRRRQSIPGYEIISLVGKGAMAKVYKARQVSLDRIVAVKLLPPKNSDSVEFIERFYKEGRAAAKLAHNNIVQAIDVGSTPDNRHYFVMEYIEGKTLYDIMAAPPAGDGRNFTEIEALEIIIQLADALDHAHKKGLIHRDVKPKNIILTPNGVAKLTDLGLARDVDDKQAAEMEAGKAYGTPYYISPEQIRGEVDIDFRADIYSLGATMYHLVTGRPPFDGDSPSAVMHKHLKQPLVPPDHINTTLSAGVGEIIEMAMAKDRDERYHSMGDMLDDLRMVRSGSAPLHARQTTDLDTIAKIQEGAQTVDIDPIVPTSAQLLQTPLGVSLLVGLGISFLANLIMLVVLITK
jgi:serine/threonine-protein kinase